MFDQLSLVNKSDLGRRCLGIRDNVSGQYDNSLPGQIREQIAKPNTLLGVQTNGRFVHNKQLRVVELSLCDAHALFHPAGIAA